MAEVKPIPGLDNYFATSDGDIIGPKGLRKPQEQNNGYMVVGINVQGKRRNLLIHRLIMMAFYGSQQYQVNHKDGNKKNNRLDNLEYVTASQNQRHSVFIGLRKTTPIQASNNGFGYVCFSEREWKDLGFNSAHVYSCAKGSRKTHRGFSFERTNCNTL